MNVFVLKNALCVASYFSRVIQGVHG